MAKYDHKKIEKKWQKYWDKNKIFRVDDSLSAKITGGKYYALDMFPYPSSAGLHVGHPEGYTATDIVSRYRRMKYGENVLHPIGFDAFGLPAENYAIKMGRHPREITEENIENFIKQLKSLGFSYDWNRQVVTSRPDYYKWTQWMFAQLYKRGLAYKKEAPVNWCESCKTVLAREQVIDGKCERCKSEVIQKNLKQWFFKITDYADELLEEVEKLDWPEPIKALQRNWIGRSEGALVKFKIRNQKSEINSKFRIAKYDKVLLASKNLSKKKRIDKLFKSAGLDIDLLSPNDLGLSKADTLEEGGLLENAKEKALAYRDKTNLPILAVDTGLFIKGSGIDPIKVKRNSLKGKNENELTQKEVAELMMNYYKNIAEDNGGEVEAEWRDVFVLSLPDGTMEHSESVREVILTNKPTKKRDIYFPIRSLYKPKVTGKYALEQTEEEELEELAPVIESLVKLLGEQAGGDKNNYLEVFTTRPDTLFGVTFMVVAPEHPLIENYKLQITNYKEVEEYIRRTKKKNELERTDLNKDKTGVELKGLKAVNPVNGEEIPIYVADYVMMSYGSGAIMAVPAHDERDFEFAKKYSIEVMCVIEPRDLETGELIRIIGNSPDENPQNILKDIYEGKRCYTGNGFAINSGDFNGLPTQEFKKEITKWLEKKGVGKKQVQYKLRDWLVSRQRYWGAPIPIIYCEKCAKKKYNYVLLHGFGGSSKSNFLPWLKDELEKKGYDTYCLNLPNTENPTEEEQVNFILKNFKFDENTILFGHSLGAVDAMKVVEKLDIKIAGLVLAGGFVEPKFKDNKRVFEDKYNWSFDFEKIKSQVGFVKILSSKDDYAVPIEQGKVLHNKLSGGLYEVVGSKPHFTGEVEPEVLDKLLVRGEYLMPESELPVELPDDVDFRPTGESPLAGSKKFHKVKCPKCGAAEGVRREVDTMDTFVCSSWYFLRYADPHNDKEPFDKEKVEKWMPVDLYVGGAEHAVLHLMYARFFTKALADAGYLDFREPFKKLRNQGMILAEDGKKMSKSLGNVINPDDVVEQYGADTLRMYEMFMGPLEDSKPWSTKGIVGIRRFLDKVWRLQSKLKTQLAENKELKKTINKTIKKVTEDIEEMKFNTAISAMMVLVNEFEKQDLLLATDYRSLIILLSPFAPHLAEELWENLGNDKSIIFEKWPKWEENSIKDEEIKIMVQVNGKIRDEITVGVDIGEDEIKKLALETRGAKKWIGGKDVKKVIYVKGKLVSVVV